VAKKQKDDLREPKVDKAHFKVRVAGEREKRLDVLIGILGYRVSLHDFLQIFDANKDSYKYSQKQKI
jgi:hypothetical protein